MMDACENVVSHSGGRVASAEHSITRHEFLRFQRNQVLWTQVWLDQGPAWIGMLEMLLYIFGLNIGYTIQSFPSDNKISAAT